MVTTMPPKENARILPLFKMSEASVAQASTEGRSIRVNTNPRAHDEATTILIAFSREGQLEQQSTQDSKTIPISLVPRMRKCYGWLKLRGQMLLGIHMALRAPPPKISKMRRILSSDEVYVAAVDEYVEEGDNDPTCRGGNSELFLACRFWLHTFVGRKKLEEWSPGGSC